MSCPHSRAFPSLDHKSGWFCPTCDRAVEESEIKPPEVEPPSSPSIRAWQTLNTHRSHGNLYYQYSWGQGHKVLGCRHIKGGNTDNPIAQSRAAQVEKWIKDGRSPQWIIHAISQFPRRGKGKR